MSRQYRAWRDHLSDQIKEHLSAEEPYDILHTASLVGLFSCIFVKASQRECVRNTIGSEVKRGMGGLHGNKVGNIFSRRKLTELTNITIHREP